MIPIYALFISVLLITLVSMLALDASLSLIGNRLRAYFIYVFIPALICLVGGKQRFNFFIWTILILGIIACLIHFAEFARGGPFIIQGYQPKSIYSREFGTGEFHG